MAIRYALLGGGMMGREHLQNIALLPDAEVVAIAEPNDAMQARCRQLVPDARYVSTLDELIQSPDFDALIIATPNYQHADQLEIALSHKDLAILIEKPLVTRLEDISRIRELADKHRAPLWVAMEYRYMPPLAAFRDQLARVGRLQTLSIQEHRFPFLKKVNDWNRFNRNSGGTLVEKCCHFFDLFRLIMDEEVSHVYASMGQNCNHIKERYDGEQPDIADNAYVTLEFESNRRALLDLNMFAEGSAYQEEIRAVGHRAKLECLIPGPSITWPDDQPEPLAKLIYSPRHPRGPETQEVAVDEAILRAGSHHGSTYYEHLAFKAAMETGSPVEVTVEDGLKAVLLGMAAQASAESKQVAEIENQGLSFRLR